MGKSLIKTIFIIASIFILLAGAVFAIFNGIIEIIEETLGNIVDFLTNPLGFINQLAQDFHNTVETIRPEFLGGEKVYKFDDTETCRFFLSSEMVDQLAENLSSGDVLTDYSQFYSGIRKGKGGILGGAPGEFKQQGNLDTDGYEQTYTSSAGITYKDFKQNRGPWRDIPYGGGDNTIGSYGCGITSMAIIASGLGHDDVTPAVTMQGYDLSYIGESSEYFGHHMTASEITSTLKSGKVIAMHYFDGAFFTMGASMHFIAIVDVDEQGRFLVLNPCYVPGSPQASGWFSAGEIEAGNREGYIVDVSKAKKNTSNSSTKNSNKAKLFDSLDGFLFIGDSITAGLERSGALSGVTYRGASGSTVEDWVNNTPAKDSGHETFSSLPSNSSSIKAISIMLGTNQVNIDEDKTINDMKELIKKVHSKYPDKLIFIQKILPIDGQQKESYNKKLEELSNQFNYTVCVDPTTFVEISNDRVHPTDEGYKTLAENIKEVILGADITLDGNGEKIYNDPTMFKGALDLDKTGLQKTALRDIILASYVTQATTDTVVGIEVPAEEMEERCPVLKEALDLYTLSGDIPIVSAISDILAFPSKLVADIRY